MRYRVRGPLHSDTSHIATELRGFIAHTGPIRLGYLQMHGVAAHTIDVSDNGAAFFEETVLPKIGAAGSFVEQRTALRQPKDLKLAATLCPTTAARLPNLTEWAGVWSEVVYGPRRATVRLRCLLEDAERLRDLERQGWRVLRGPATLLAWLTKAAPFAPQFWPSRAGCAAASAPGLVAPPMASELAPAKVSSLTASEVLAEPGASNLLLGVTPTGQGVRLAWRAMMVAVQDGGERQDTVIPALLFRALSQGMGALVIAERAKVTPRAMSFLAKRLRLIDMANPWESARIPWRSLPPEGLKLLLGGELPSPLPETFADALRAVGQRNLATPVVEALTREPAYDLAGTLEAGGGVVLLVEPGASASLMASLLILNLSLARITRPLLICRPASLPMPAPLTDKAVQFVLGDAPAAVLELRAAPDSWVARFPDGQQLTLQENLAAPVEEQAGADHAALITGLDGRGWTPEEAAALAALPAQLDEAAGLSWPESLEEGDEAVVGVLAPGNAPAGLSWPEELEEEGDEDGAGLQDADEAPAVVSDGDLGAMLAADVTPGLPEAEGEALEGEAGLDWPESLEEGDEDAAGLQDAEEAPEELADDELARLAADEGGEAHSWLAALTGDEVAPLVVDEGDVGLQEAEETPEELPGDELAPLAADEGGEAALGVLTPESAPADLDWPDDLEVGDGPVELASVQTVGMVDPALLWQEGGDEVPADDVEAWPISLLDDEALTELAPGKQSLRRSPGRRRRRILFTPDTHQRVAAVVDSVSDDEGGAGLQRAEETPEELAGDELVPLAADEVLAELAGDDLGEGDEGDVGLQEAEEVPEELAPLATDEGSAAQGWPADLADEELAPLTADEGGAGLQEAEEAPEELAGDELAPLTADEGGAGLQEAEDTPEEASMQGIATLVAAWQRGESLTRLARELRQQQPALSLLEATQILKAAINSEGVAAPAPVPPALAAPAPAQRDRLVELLRGLAAVEPVEPVAQEALRRWREGGQRRQVVRDLATAFSLKEPDARAVFDRVIFPRVISDLNGSTSLVVSYLREAGSEAQAELPAAVVDCATRLLGNTSPHASKARALLPVMRELLVTLDEAGRS